MHLIYILFKFLLYYFHNIFKLDSLVHFYNFFNFQLVFETKTNFQNLQNIIFYNNYCYPLDEYHLIYYDL